MVRRWLGAEDSGDPQPNPTRVVQTHCHTLREIRKYRIKMWRYGMGHAVHRGGWLT
jgi:hypothetical protein